MSSPRDRWLSVERAAPDTRLPAASRFPRQPREIGKVLYARRSAAIGSSSMARHRRYSHFRVLPSAPIVIDQGAP